MYDPKKARIQELNVFPNVVSGFQQVLGSLAAGRGEKPWPVVITANTTSFRQVFKETQKEILPQIGLIIQSARPSSNYQGFNNQASYNGIYLGTMNADSPTPLNVILHFRTVMIEVSVLVAAQNYKDIINFASRWMYRDREVQFTLETDLYSLPVKVTLMQELSIPEEEFSEIANLFVFQTSAELIGFVGELEYVPRTTSISVSTEAWDPATQSSVQTSRTMEIKK